MVSPACVYEYDGCVGVATHVTRNVLTKALYACACDRCAATLANCSEDLTVEFLDLEKHSPKNVRWWR